MSETVGKEATSWQFAPEIQTDDAMKAWHFHRDKAVEAIHPNTTDDEATIMRTCLDFGANLLDDGNPPVAAALYSSETGKIWTAKTDDRTSHNIGGHAENLAYHMAHADVGDNLSECTLITVTQPCTSCTPPYAEGKIGRIIYAINRATVHSIAGIMRQREINMPELLRDGDTDTEVVEGLFATRAIDLFQQYARIRAG